MRAQCRRTRHTGGQKPVLELTQWNVMNGVMQVKTPSVAPPRQPVPAFRFKPNNLSVDGGRVKSGRTAYTFPLRASPGNVLHAFSFLLTGKAQMSSDAKWYDLR